MRIIMKLVAFIACCVLPSVSFALPATSNTRVLWDAVGGASGYYLYWCDPVATNPCQYTDARKIDVGNVTEVVVLGAIPNAVAKLKFRVTAYDVDKRESAFSDEVEGWFGLQSPGNVRIQ